MADKPKMVRGTVAGGTVEIPEEKAARMGSAFTPEKTEAKKAPSRKPSAKTDDE